MSVRCPHCKRRVEGAVYRYEVSAEAVRRVILHASADGNNGVHVSLLAKTYQAMMRLQGRSITRLAARKAVERLAKDKLLIALGKGFYRAAGRSSRYARDGM